ncbi:MAG: TolB family protein, partial [Cyclobacteriaceae bacterium]
HDFAATPYRETNQLLLTSTRDESKGFLYHQQHGGSFSDNFLFSLDSGQWQDRTSLHNFVTINTTADEGPGVLSPDGRRYYFSRLEKGYYQLFVSEIRNEKWHEAQLLPQPINLKGYTAKHPTVSDSGDTLYFSSDRPGGFGECDIWMSVRQQNVWQPPINLGASVNTSFQETSPYWDGANQVLFFASNGHPGWGGYDLYMAVIQSLRLPQHVVNLGRPLNSSHDDTYIWAADRLGYITSNRGNSTTGFDIYQYRFVPQAKQLFTLNSQSLWETWADRLLKTQDSEKDEESRLFFDVLPSHE